MSERNPINPAAVLSDLLELAGLGCVTAAAFLMALPLGLLTLGLSLLLIGVTLA